MSLLKHKMSERRWGQERRRGISRRKTATKRRLRVGFRTVVLQSLYRRRGKDHTPMSKVEWLQTLVRSAAIEASRYVVRDRTGSKVPWRIALERAGEFAWDLNEARFAHETRVFTAVEHAARMTEATVDYLLAEYSISHIGRRGSGDRRSQGNS